VNNSSSEMLHTADSVCVWPGDLLAVMNGAYPPVLGALVTAAVWIAGGIGKPLAVWQRLAGGLPVWMAASTWAWRRAPGRAVEGTRHLPRQPSRRGTPGDRQVTFTGTDTLRIAGGKLAGYWATPAACCSSSNSVPAGWPPRRAIGERS
jgi:hypothetical protein